MLKTAILAAVLALAMPAQGNACFELLDGILLSVDRALFGPPPAYRVAYVSERRARRAARRSR